MAGARATGIDGGMAGARATGIDGHMAGARATGMDGALGIFITFLVENVLLCHGTVPWGAAVRTRSGKEARCT